MEEKSGCLARLIRFFGANDKELLGEGCGEGEGVYGLY